MPGAVCIRAVRLLSVTHGPALHRAPEADRPPGSEGRKWTCLRLILSVD